MRRREAVDMMPGPRAAFAPPKPAPGVIPSTLCLSALAYLAAAGSGMRLLGVVTVGDFLWLSLVVGGVLPRLAKRVAVGIWAPSMAALAFLVATSLTSLWRLVVWGGVTSDFVAAVGRGLLYIVGTAVLYPMLRDRKSVIAGIGTAAAAHAAVALALVIPVLLPLSMFGEGPGLFGTIGLSERITAGGSVWQLEGFTSEPAYFSALQAMSIPFLVAAKEFRWRWTGIALLLVVTSIVASQSLSGIGLAVVGLTSGHLYMRHRQRAGLQSGGRRSLATALIVSIAVTTAALGGVTKSIESRFAYVREGSDKSSQVRLATGWRPAVIALSESPIVGVGWGNVGEHAFSREASLLGEGLTTERFSWNAFALLLGSTGLLGGCLFVVFLAKVGFRSTVALALIVGWAFTSALILQPTFWVFLVLLVRCFPRARPETRAESRARHVA
jgi:hypothetical protein